MKDLKLNALKFLASSALVAVTGAASADQVFVDDVIVQGSLCVGFDCANGEAFGFDTIRLKENNTRIKFDDTSNSGSFPNVDWELQANESSNGGNNWFALLNGTNSTRPFTVYNGAGNNAMVLSAAGRLGLGTASPGVDIDIQTGNTPALRLQQDSSAGFAAQTWDVAGNETNFFVRDVTNGSQLPFKIRPSAPSNSLYIDTDGDVGFGTASPAAKLHVVESDNITGATDHVIFQNNNASQAQRTMLTLRNNGGSQIILDNSASGFDWRFAHRNVDGDFSLFSSESGLTPFLLTTTGDLTITGGLVTGTAGSCTAATPCDAVFDRSVYDVPSIEQHASLMWENKFLPAVGRTRAGEPVNMTEKMLGMLNELEHAHIYIEQLNDRISQLETALDAEQN